MRRFSSILAALVLTGLLGAPALAEKIKKPPISVGSCIEHGGGVEQPDGSAIRACCMDSDVTGIRGCYICDSNWENCTWEPAKGGRKGEGNDAPLDLPDQPLLKAD